MQMEKLVLQVAERLSSSYTDAEGGRWHLSTGLSVSKVHALFTVISDMGWKGEEPSLGTLPSPRHESQGRRDEFHLLQ